MDTSDWVTAAFAAVAVVISGIALKIAWWNARSDSRAAIAAEDSAKSAREAADSAARLTQIEVAREHEAHKPPMPKSSDFVIERLPSGEENLMLVFRSKRSYRTRGDLIEGNERFPAHLGLVQPAGHDIRVFIQRLRPQRDTTNVDKVHLRYWPPAEGDPHTEFWTCPCDRPFGTGSDQDVPHWEQTIPVVMPERVEALVTWA